MKVVWEISSFYSLFSLSAVSMMMMMSMRVWECVSPASVCEWLSKYDCGLPPSYKRPVCILLLVHRILWWWYYCSTTVHHTFKLALPTLLKPSQVSSNATTKTEQLDTAKAQTRKRRSGIWTTVTAAASSSQK